MDHDPFHPGEHMVQAQAGVQVQAQRIGQSIKTFLPTAAQDFLQRQQMVIVASIDTEHQVWASILTGDPGCITVLDEWTALIDAKPLPGDPLAANILTNPMIGLLAIEFASRRRMRLNGRVERATDGRLLVHAQQVYANCPKYIQARQIEGTPGTELNPSIVHVATGLNQSQQQWITQADTFFIASAHPAGGADASHRGGHPGFIQMLDDSALLWPDYTGNMMFNTLGNIAVHPQSGLLFLDFATGSTLQMTGQAQIIWDEALVQPYPGAERLVRYSISQVIETAQRLPWCWEFMSYSPFHPEVSERGHE